MITIAVINKKGGSGKTTLTINLAATIANKRKTVAIIDIDDQVNATKWGDRREQENPTVVSAQPARLKNVLQAAEEEGADWCFIDTPARTESPALAAAKVADLILIPIMPGLFDLEALEQTKEMLDLIGVPVKVILNQVQPRSIRANEIAEAIENLGWEIAKIRLGRRNDFKDSINDGLAVTEFNPNDKAALEIQNLYKEILKATKLLPV